VKDERLHARSSESNHGKAAVNDFLFHSPPDLLVTLTLQQTKEIPTDITLRTLPVVLVKVGQLDNGNSEEYLRVTLESDRAYRGEGVEFSELSGVGGREMPTATEGTVLLGYHTYYCQHADTTVLQLSPAGVLGGGEGEEGSERKREFVVCVRVAQKQGTQL